MDLPVDQPQDPRRQALHDHRRFRRGLLASGLFVVALWWVLMIESALGASFRHLAVYPGEPSGLVGVVFAPLLHGSPEHLAANSLPLLVLGTLSLALYPRASLRALLLIWLASGLGVWLIGRPSFHLGASGLGHGLMFFVFLMGLLRRDRASIAAAFIAFFLYGGMLLTVFPREPGVSWEYHLCGALAGALAAILWRRLDPLPPRKKYSWELEEELEELQRQREAEGFEPPRPEHVPVLWHREPEERGVVLPFRPRGEGKDDEPPRPPTLH
jgi:membrane associated rhomboid family serine protease